MAGYHVVLGLARLAVPSDVWQGVFAAMGALIIGLTATVRLAGPECEFLPHRTRVRARPLTAQAVDSTQ
jgi:hypothetical protein